MYSLYELFRIKTANGIWEQRSPIFRTGPYTEADEESYSLSCNEHPCIPDAYPPSALGRL